MAKYNIVKENTINGSGKLVKSEFVIKKKFLFFWMRALTHSFYKINDTGPVYLFKNSFSFDTYDKAREHLELMFVQPTKINHLGKTIIKAYNDYYQSSPMVYVDKSYIVKEFNGHECYHASRTLKEATDLIDRRILKVKKQVISSYDI